MIDLDDRQTEIVLRILESLIPEYEVWVFGSRIKGTSRPYSDLDLVVVSQESVSRNKILDLKEAFDESNLDIKVDILDINSVSEGFKKIIQSQYEVFKKPHTLS